MDRNSPPSYIEPSAQASLDDTISLITHIRSLPPHSPSVRSSMTPPLSPPASAGTSCPPSTSSPHQILPPLPNHLNNSLSSPRSCLSLPSQPPLVQPILTPRFAISTTPQLLSHLHSLITSEAAKGTPLHVQTHLCENHNEIAFTKELFAKPDARELMRECLKRRAGVSGDGNEEWDGTYTGVYDAFGLLGERTVLAHCVSSFRCTLDPLYPADHLMRSLPPSFLSHSFLLPLFPSRQTGPSNLLRTPHPLPHKLWHFSLPNLEPEYPLRPVQSRRPPRSRPQRRARDGLQRRVREWDSEPDQSGWGDE
jgi:hypothetical protein